MNKKIIKLLLLIAVVMPMGLRAQNIAEIAKSDPLLISGVIGTQNTYYYSSVGSGHSSPLNNSVYANLNISVYGINMPFSFMYTNNNTSFSYPHFSFNISPTYKNWTLHIGRRTMGFSNYIYNTPFNGAGIEYNGRQFRFGAFYGLLQKSINDDPTDPNARMPQYKRMGWGMKVGYGNRVNYIDLFLFRAKDQINSIDSRWQDRYSPQENIAIGVNGRVSLKRYLSLTANMAMSVFSQDLNSERLEIESLNNWDKVFDARFSSLYRFAGDVNLNFNVGKLNGMVSYKMIQPDYKTLGSNYISNNIQRLGISLNQVMMKGKLNLSGNFSAQEDNLSGKQLYTTKGFVYSANANVNMIENLALNLAYNGYRQLQSNGTEVVNDTTRVNRIMHSFTAGPSYNITGDALSHYIGVSYSFNMNKDLNLFHEGVGDITTNAFGANYSLTFNRTGINCNASYTHQSSRGYETHYDTDMISMGISRSMLEEKNLKLSADVSTGINRYADQKSLSYGVNAGASYSIKKVHQLSFGAAVNKFNDYYVTSNTTYSGYELQLSLNYSYTFTLLELKRKSDEQ